MIILINDSLNHSFWGGLLRIYKNTAVWGKVGGEIKLPTGENW
jgi:hypothetical protein